MNVVLQNLPKMNVCLYGQGIVCGLTVHVNDTCDIEIGGGTTVTSEGTVVKVASHLFHYYLKEPSKVVSDYFPQNIQGKTKEDPAVIELVEGDYKTTTMDSLSKQFPSDLPTRLLLEDKILVILVNEGKPTEQKFLLVTPSVLVEKKGGGFKKSVQELSKFAVKDIHSGIFSRHKPKTPEYKRDIIEQVEHPFLQLSDVIIPRFGYKTLAIKDKGQPFGTDNFMNPLSNIKNFEDVFKEYKAILDSLIPEFVAALEKLHTLFGDNLTHKGKDYWAQYRRILYEKWVCFLEEGEHLYYIQYFYDWLTDMVKAYDELREQLSTFFGVCQCPEEQPKQDKPDFAIIQLGPVLGGRTSYTRTIFRDYFQPPMLDGENETHWREIQFLHWRLMMMIWTFDLPQLKLDEKVLLKGKYIIRSKEIEDSTNYFEKTNTDDDPEANLEDLPIKFTPSQTLDTLLEQQAIPYYYPLDADSPYSIHRFWHYRLTQLKQMHKIRSYNAFKGTDSYAFITEKKYHKDALYPLAFNLRNHPFLRVEGHIGKVLKFIEVKNSTGSVQKLDMSAWQSLIEHYNLTLQIIAIPFSKLHDCISEKPGLGKAFNIGFEHIGGLEQGQTLVLVYTDEDEQIDLTVCKKDEAPEVVKHTIVADFTMPFFIVGK